MISLLLLVLLLLIIYIKFDINIDILYDDGIKYVIWYTSLSDVRKYKIFF